MDQTGLNLQASDTGVSLAFTLTFLKHVLTSSIQGELDPHGADLVSQIYLPPTNLVSLLDNFL
jgi:hypothetical protein